MVDHQNGDSNHRERQLPSTAPEPDSGLDIKKFGHDTRREIVAVYYIPVHTKELHNRKIFH